MLYKDITDEVFFCNYKIFDRILYEQIMYLFFKPFSGNNFELTNKIKIGYLAKSWLTLNCLNLENMVHEGVFCQCCNCDICNNNFEMSLFDGQILN